MKSKTLCFFLAPVAAATFCFSQPAFSQTTDNNNSGHTISVKGSRTVTTEDGMVYKDVPNGKDVKGIKALKAEITACKKNYSNPQDQANCADFAKSAIDAIYKAKALGLNTTSTVVYANQSKAPDAAPAITDNQEIAHIQADKKKVKHYTSLCKAQLGPVALKTKTADFSDRVHQLMFEVSPERVEKPFGRIQVGEQLKN